MRDFVIALAAGLALPAAAFSATLNVNSTADELIAGNGQCTLREAIINANGDSDTTAGDCAAGSGADLINVPAGTYVLTGGYLLINSDLTLRGAGAAITALVQTFSRVVGVLGGNVVIERLRVTGEYSGLENSFGLANSGNLVVSEVIISGDWDGVFNSGDLLLRRSAVINNGLLPYRYALRNVGNARIEGSTFSGCLVISSLEQDFIAQYEAFPIEVSYSTITSDGSCSPLLYWDHSFATISGTLLGNAGCWDGGCGPTDPTLGPLQDNGGPTPTHALRLGSPAIDAIPSAACTYDHDGDPGTPEIALTKDQRGSARPREGNGTAPMGCDVGAYEVTACADGIDNDTDGLVDFDGGATAGITPLGSPDPNCGSALGNSEVPPPPPGCGFGPELAGLLPALWWLRRRRRSPMSPA